MKRGARSFFGLFFTNSLIYYVSVDEKRTNTGDRKHPIHPIQSNAVIKDIVPVTGYPMTGRTHPIQFASMLTTSSRTLCSTWERLAPELTNATVQSFPVLANTGIYIYIQRRTAPNRHRALWAIRLQLSTFLFMQAGLKKMLAVLSARLPEVCSKIRAWKTRLHRVELMSYFFKELLFALVDCVCCVSFCLHADCVSVDFEGSLAC